MISQGLIFVPVPMGTMPDRMCVCRHSAHVGTFDHRPPCPQWDSLPFLVWAPWWPDDRPRSLTARTPQDAIIQARALARLEPAVALCTETWTPKYGSRLGRQRWTFDVDGRRVLVEEAPR